MNKTIHCVTLRMCALGSKGDSNAGDLMAVPALPGLTWNECEHFQAPFPNHGTCYQAGCNTQVEKARQATRFSPQTRKDSVREGGRS